MEATAGSVTIQITASTTAFEAALAKAKEQAAAFDAAVSAKLSGAGMSAGLAKIASLVEQDNQLLAKMVAAATPAAAVFDKITSATKTTAAAVESLNVAAMETKAAFSVMGAQAQQYEIALGQVNAANKIGVELEKQRTVLATNTTGALTGQASAARTVAAETGHLGSEARLGAAQMMALSHSARSAVESLALGVSPLQALTMQANHLSFALTGPQGLIAASAGARAAVGAFLTSVPGMITTAGVAAIGGLATYIIETRNSIQSVDQVLSAHKSLIAEIAGGWPEAAKAAAGYAEAAKRIPQSVALADIKEQIKENQKTLDDTLGFLSTRLKGLSEEWGLVGTAGTKAFADLARIANSGAVDAADQIESALGRMRIDPALNENAHLFAKELQESASQAAKLQDALREKNVVGDIVGNNKRAAETLYTVSAGFKDVGAAAGNADAVISKFFGDMNAGSDRFGVTRSQNPFGAQLTGSVQATVGAFQQVDQAIQEARRSQLGTFLDLDNQLRSTTQEATLLKQALASAAGPENAKLFFNDTSGIANANAELQRSVDTVNRLFDALNSGSATTRTVFDGIDMIRQSLVRDGFGVDAVNKFLDALVHTRMQIDQDTAGARQLNQAIQAIKDRVVNVTVITRQIGSGTQSLYDVPSSNGGTSSVGVTRYGGEPGQSSGPSVSSYSVPTEGYGSQGGVGSGSGTVTVTRFGGTRAGGGPVAAGLPYWVGERGPELVVPSGAGTVVPTESSMAVFQALASAQSAFTGTQPTREDDRLWVVLMNIESHTRKTAEVLDEIRTATASTSSVFGGSSSGGSSSVSTDPQQAEWDAVFNQAFRTAQANYAAARASGGGDGIVPFAQGLVATPAEIARNAANLATGRGGTPSVGFAGQTSYERDMAADYSNVIRSVFSGVNNLIDANGVPVKTYPGFASGGIYGGDAGDTQKVEFFKNPDEKVIIARPNQFQDVRSQAPAAAAASSAADRPIHISMPIYIQGNGQVSKDSAAELRRQATLAVREALRGINGR